MGVQLNLIDALVNKCFFKNVFVTVLPEHTFMDFMKSKGKEGGQHKFPRVLKGKMLEEWEKFLANELVI